MLRVTTNSSDHSRRDEVRSKGGWACLCVVAAAVAVAVVGVSV